MPDCHMYCNAASRSRLGHSLGIGGLNIPWEIVAVGRRGFLWFLIGDCPRYWGLTQYHCWVGGRFHCAPPWGV